MKIDCVLTAVNTNPLYLEFVPYFIKVWTKIMPTVHIKIILIADSIPDDLVEYHQYLVLFSPIKNISTSFTSQYIRLLYPALLTGYKEGIMITDIDMIPLNKKYYIENIVTIPDNKFVYYRGNRGNKYKQIIMCYNLARAKTWSAIFNIKSIEDIIHILKKRYKSSNYQEGHNNSGWSTDQQDLYKYVLQWNKSTQNFIRLNEKKTGFNRLNPNGIDSIDSITKNNIIKGHFTDYHCLRPFNDHYNINMEIYNLL